MNNITNHRDLLINYVTRLESELLFRLENKDAFKDTDTQAEHFFDAIESFVSDEKLKAILQ